MVYELNIDKKKNASYINVIPEQRNKQTKKKNNYDKLLCW